MSFEVWHALIYFIGTKLSEFTPMYKVASYLATDKLKFQEASFDNEDLERLV